MKCLNCNIVMKKKTTNYSYIDCGLKNVVLKNVDVCVCEECGEEEIMIPNMEHLHQTIAIVVAKQEPRLLPDEIRFLRSHLGFSGVEYAKAIDVTPETVSRWENGKEPMSLSQERFLRFMILSAVEPKRDYHNGLFNLGTRERKTKGKHVFTEKKKVWREVA